MSEFKENLDNKANVNYEDLTRKRAELFKFLSESDQLFEMQDEIVEFVRKLKNENPNYQANKLYHLLVGSTLDREGEESDFPGEYSIADFINRLYEKYVLKHK